jgi:hypothetical protein
MSIKFHGVARYGNPPLKAQGSPATLAGCLKVVSCEAFFPIFPRFCALCVQPAGRCPCRGAPPYPVFVLNSLDGNVSVIDPLTWKEVKRIPPARSRTTCT